MKMTKTLCAVRGLVGVTDNHGRTKEADRMLVEAVSFAGTTHSDKEEDEMVGKIHAFLNVLSPDCGTCAFPCGNTSDYDMNLYLNNSEALRIKKDEVIDKMISLADEINTSDSLPEDKVFLLYKCITYITLDLATESYDQLLHQIQE